MADKRFAVEANGLCDMLSEGPLCHVGGKHKAKVWAETEELCRRAIEMAVDEALGPTPSPEGTLAGGIAPAQQDPLPLLRGRLVALIQTWERAGATYLEADGDDCCARIIVRLLEDLRAALGLPHGPGGLSAPTPAALAATKGGETNG